MMNHSSIGVRNSACIIYIFPEIIGGPTNLFEEFPNSCSVAENQAAASSPGAERLELVRAAFSRPHAKQQHHRQRLFHAQRSPPCCDILFGHQRQRLASVLQRAGANGTRFEVVGQLRLERYDHLNRPNTFQVIANWHGYSADYHYCREDMPINRPCQTRNQSFSLALRAQLRPNQLLQVK